VYDNHAEARAFRDCDLGAVAGPGIKYPAPPDSNFAEREHAVNNVASVSLAIDGFIIVDNNDILVGKGRAARRGGMRGTDNLDLRRAPD